MFLSDYWKMLRKHHRAASIISTKAILSLRMLSTIPGIFILGELFLRRHEGSAFLWSGGTEYTILYFYLTAFVCFTGLTAAPALGILDAMPSRWHWSAPAIYLVGNTIGMVYISLHVGERLNMLLSDLPTPFEIATINGFLIWIYRSLSHQKMIELVQGQDSGNIERHKVNRTSDTPEPRGYDNVILVRARDHYCELFTRNSNELIRCTLSELEERMGKHLGLRVHRSYWVSFAAIGKFDNNSRAPRIKLSIVPDQYGDELVPVARTRRDRVSEIIHEHHTTRHCLFL